MNISLVKTKKGNYSLQVRCDDGSEKVLHSLYDPEEEARTIVDAFRFDGKGILVVLGLGLGYHLSVLIQRFPYTEIVVVEAYSEIYELAKEYGSKLAKGVRFIIGFSPSDAFREITRYQMKGGIKPLSVFVMPSAASAFRDYYHPILSSIEKAMSVKLWDKLRYPKFREDDVKIVLINSNYFLIKEVGSAIKSLGHSVENITVEKNGDNAGLIPIFIEKILAFKPDFFLTINHLGFDEGGVLTSFLKSIEMPVASWYVDSPNLIVKAFDKNVSSNVAVFIWDRTYLKDMESMGYESVSYLPLAADEKVFMPIKLNKKTLEQYRCDVGFVGASMLEPVNKWLSKVDKKFHALIEKLADDPLKLRGKIDMLLKSLLKSDMEMINKLDKKERIDLEAAIIWKATLKYRLSCLKTLNGFDMRIHGDAGWKHILGSDFGIFPSLNYYRDLPSFYNVCKINFNATSLQMGEAVNQRVFDVPACGSFLLTDHQKGLGDLFDIGKEVVSYSNLTEIPELVKFYLKNKRSREEIAKRGRERVLKEHTYRHRINSIINFMKKRYS